MWNISHCLHMNLPWKHMHASELQRLFLCVCFFQNVSCFACLQCLFMLKFVVVMHCCSICVVMFSTCICLHELLIIQHNHKLVNQMFGWCEDSTVIFKWISNTCLIITSHVQLNWIHKLLFVNMCGVFGVCYFPFLWCYPWCSQDQMLSCAI